MKGYAAEELFSARALELHAAATVIVTAFPYQLEGEHVRCHEVARAVGSVLALEVEDGTYGIVSHSWLRIDARTILDCYAVGRFPPVQLVDQSDKLPESKSYKQRGACDDIQEHALHELLSIAKLELARSFPRL